MAPDTLDDKSSKWIVIDWEDADGYQNNSADHLTTEEHAPETFQQNHSGRSCVGKLIIDASKWILGLSQRIIKFGNNLQSNNSDKRPSAKKALKKFKKIKEKYQSE